MIRKIVFSSVLIVILFSFSVVAPVAAKKPADYSGNSTSNSTVKLDNPLGEGVTIAVLIGKIINAILGVVGSLALLMFVYGGLVWMTSGGNQEKIKSGRDTIVWSAIGLIIIFVSYGLVRFLILGVKG